MVRLFLKRYVKYIGSYDFVVVMGLVFFFDVIYNCIVDVYIVG